MHDKYIFFCPALLCLFVVVVVVVVFFLGGGRGSLFCFCFESHCQNFVCLFVLFCFFVSRGRQHSSYFP